MSTLTRGGAQIPHVAAATRVKSVRRGKNHNQFWRRAALVRERSRVQFSLAAPLHAIDLAARSAASRKFNMSRDIRRGTRAWTAKTRKTVLIFRCRAQSEP